MRYVGGLRLPVECTFVQCSNEKLQQVFVDKTLKREQSEYLAEGIQWSRIDFFDNIVVCELLESKRVSFFFLFSSFFR